MAAPVPAQNDFGGVARLSRRYTAYAGVGARGGRTQYKLHRVVRNAEGWKRPEVGRLGKPDARFAPGPVTHCQLLSAQIPANNGVLFIE